MFLLAFPPLQVTRSGLTNACGIAGIMLTTQAVMVEQRKPKAAVAGGEYCRFGKKSFEVVGAQKLLSSVRGFGSFHGQWREPKSQPPPPSRFFRRCRTCRVPPPPSPDLSFAPAFLCFPLE